MTVENGSSWPQTRPTLLAKLRSPDAADAWVAFVSTYGPLLYRYCRARGLQDADAQDVAQVVLVKVQRFEYHPERGRFRGWLKTVTAREVQHHRDKLARPGRGTGGADSEETPLDDVASGGDVAWERIFHAQILETALDRVRREFSDEEWRAFEAVALRVVDSPDGRRVEWIESPAPAEVAKVLRRPVGWVYKTKSRVQSRLKEEILYLAEDIGAYV